MGRLLRWGALFTLLGAFALPAQADPLVMFLLGFAKNVIERKIQEANRAPAPLEVMPDLGKTYPGTTVEPDVIRRLIGDSFIYLSEAQRNEIFFAFNKALLDPKTAGMRGEMIEHFARKALAVRAAQVRLSQLSTREKQMLAEEFKRETEGATDTELVQLREVIQMGLLPVPMDLSQMFLTVLEARPVPVAGQPAPTAGAATPAITSQVPSGG